VSPRGCLITILAFVAIVIGVLWFALPPVIGGLAVGALENAGVHGTDTHVDVGADPPLRLLTLEADRVRLRSSNVEIRNVHADSVDVTLRDVSIGRRSFGFIEGRLTGVRVTPDRGPVFEASQVQINGPEEAARVAISVDRKAFQNLVSSAVAISSGTRVDGVTLAAPDRVTVVTPRGSIAGRLDVTPAGELVLLPSNGGSISLVGTGSDQPVRLQSVQVVDDGLELAGTISLVP
jgi:hypothetical protein